MLSQFVFPSKAILFNPSVQIDMVALPNQVKEANPEAIDKSLPVKDEPPPPSKPEPQEEEPEAVPIPEKQKAAEPTIKNKKEVEKRAKSAVEKLREQMKKEREEIEQKKQEELSKREENLKKFKEKYRAAIRGNQTNEGTSLTGDMQATVNAYGGAVVERLKPNWNLPVYLQSKGLRASVRVYLDGRGYLVRYQMSQGSGNDAFDEYVIKTIKAAIPSPLPPRRWQEACEILASRYRFPYENKIYTASSRVCFSLFLSSQG